MQQKREAETSDLSSINASWTKPHLEQNPFGESSSWNQAAGESSSWIDEQNIPTIAVHRQSNLASESEGERHSYSKKFLKQIFTNL